MMKMIRRILIFILVGAVVAALFIYGNKITSFFINQNDALPYLLAGVAVLIFTILAVIIFLFRSSAKTASPEFDSADIDNETIGKSGVHAEKADFSIKELGKHFAWSVKRLRAGISGHYKIPWFMMLGEAESGKSTALKWSDPHSEAIPFRKIQKAKRACNWCFFEKGIVIDVAGDLVLREGGASAQANIKVWRHLLRLLQKYRSKRPIDGIILTIPCTDLVFSDDDRKSAGLIRISEKTELLYEKLWNAQQTLGIRLPVYLLITKCDHVEGFRSFCRSLPERLRNHIFGWSSPYNIETAYSETWVSEAFQNINSELFRTQFEMFTKGTESEESDGLFVFPANFRMIEDSVQTYADRLFKGSVYHESFIFRGVYFCGDSGLKQSRTGGKKSWGNSDVIRPFFLRDLLEKKIFPEFGIARPLERVLMSRNRRVLGAQCVAGVIALASILGLWSAYNNLQDNKDVMKIVYKHINKDIEKLDEKEADRLVEEEKDFFPESTKNLSKGTDIAKKLPSVFFPSSVIPLPFFSQPLEKIEKSISDAYKRIVVDSMRSVLIMKGDGISKEYRTYPSRKKRGEVLFPGKTSEFEYLRNFIEDFEKFEYHFNIYNNLDTVKKQPDPEKLITGLKGLAKYLFDASLDPKYYNDSWSEVKYEPIRNRIFKVKAREGRLIDLTDRFYERIFESVTISESLEELSDQLENFKWKGRVSARRGGRSIKNVLENILETFDDTENTLSKPEFAWLSNKEFFLDEFENDILDKVRKSEFLGKDLASAMYDKGEKAFEKLKKELGQKKLLEQDGKNVIMKLSDKRLLFKHEVKKLLGQGFMDIYIPEQEGDIAKTCPPGKRVVWEVDVLKEAVDSLEPYKSFLKRQKEEFNNKTLRRLQKEIAKAAEISMNQKLWDMLGDARRLVPLPGEIMTIQHQEVYIAAEIKNLKEASKPLNTLLSDCDRLKLKGSHTILSGVLRSQTNRLIAAVNDLFEKEKIYEVRKGDDFSWWDGEQEPLSLATFDVADDIELKYYLKLQRERIKHIFYEYAEPLFTLYVSQGQKENRRFRTLKRTMEVIDYYERKIPGNSATALEKFILFDMNHISPSNYYKKIALTGLKESPDIFMQRKNDLEEKLYTRCHELAARQIVAKYTKLETFFNDRLAGNFPFSQDARRSEADPGDIRDFYRRFDADVAELEEVLKVNKQSTGSEVYEASDFLRQMKKARPVFASCLENHGGENVAEEDRQAEDDLPALDFEVKFRVNTEHERLANQIIGWHLTVGEQEFQYRGAKNKGRWRFGDPISFSLRWAKHGMYHPDADEAETVDSRTVTYKMNGDTRWSLLRFLRKYPGSPSYYDHLADPEPHTLKFDIKTVNLNGKGERNEKSAILPAISADKGSAGESAAAAEESLTTRVFIRMILMTPDKTKKVLTLPRFPVSAPDLNLSASGQARLKLRQSGAKADRGKDEEMKK